jgi:hypothetical protein
MSPMVTNDLTVIDVASLEAVKGGSKLTKLEPKSR